jgi:hypothetical protein
MGRRARFKSLRDRKVGAGPRSWIIVIAVIADWHEFRAQISGRHVDFSYTAEIPDRDRNHKPL